MDNPGKTIDEGRKGIVDMLAQDWGISYGDAARRVAVWLEGHPNPNDRPRVTSGRGTSTAARLAYGAFCREWDIAPTHTSAIVRRTVHYGPAAEEVTEVPF